MKKLLTTTFLLVLIAFAFPTENEAEAAYNPEYDKYIEITIPDHIDFPLTEEHAMAMFEKQEALHAFLRTKGIDIEYSYIWVVVNGVRVLAIDPPLVVDNGH